MSLVRLVCFYTIVVIINYSLIYYLTIVIIDVSMDAAKSSSSTTTPTKAVSQPTLSATITCPTPSTTRTLPTTSDTITHTTPSPTVNRPTSSTTMIQPSMSGCLSKEVKLRLCRQIWYLNKKLNDLHRKVTEMEVPAFRFGDLCLCHWAIEPTSCLHK